MKTGNTAVYIYGGHRFLFAGGDQGQMPFINSDNLGASGSVKRFWTSQKKQQQKREKRGGWGCFPSQPDEVRGYLYNHL